MATLTITTLTITTADGTESTHELGDGKTTIGRGGDNTLTIDDVSLSGTHAEIVAEGDGYRLTDLGSTNGTYVDGERTETVELSDKNGLMFGSVLATYRRSSPVGDSAPAPPSPPSAAGAATTSLRPNNFSNASPFTKKVKQKDPIGRALLFLGVLGIAACIAATACAFMM